MAEQTVWDTVNDRPITAEELYLKNIMDEDISWVENLNDVTFAKSTMAKVLIERPNPTSISQPAFPKSADSNTIISFHPNQASAQTDDTSDTHADQFSVTTNDMAPNESTAHDKQMAASLRSEADSAESLDKDSADEV
jgi:hypothetical protein